MELVVTWKLRHYWVAFTILKDAVHIVEESTSTHQSYPTANPVNYNKQRMAFHYRLTGATVE